MTTSPSSARRSERSRRAILRAALDLCTERGYGHVTIEAIAAAAGVSKKTIYRWWPSKGAVLLEAFTDALVDATPFVDTGDIGADLRTHVAGAVKLLSVPPFGPAYAGILSELHHDDRLAQQLREQLVDPRVEEAIGRLRSAQDRGQIPPGADLPLAVEMLYGPVYYRHVLRKPIQDEETIATLVDHVLRALRAPGTETPVRRYVSPGPSVRAAPVGPLVALGQFVPAAVDHRAVHDDLRGVTALEDPHDQSVLDHLDRELRIRHALTRQDGELVTGLQPEDVTVRFEEEAEDVVAAVPYGEPVHRFRSGSSVSAGAAVLRKPREKFAEE